MTTEGTPAAAGGSVPPMGVRLAVDVGSVRVGIAASDPRATMAVPVRTLRRGPRTALEVLALAEERAAVACYVGLPRSMSGAEGSAANAARAFAAELAVVLAPVLVRLVDERLTTVAAHRGLRTAGLSSRESRAVVDQVAAVAILESALAGERTLGHLAGEPVGADAEGARR